MKRQRLIKELRKIAKAKGVEFELVREGGEHSVYKLDGQQIPIPRHNEINEQLAKGILKGAKK